MIFGNLRMKGKEHHVNVLAPQEMETFAVGPFHFHAILKL